jgi:periplasmic protein TonB
MSCRVSPCLLPLLVAGLVTSAAAQPAGPGPRPFDDRPLPPGQRLVAADGDTVVVESGARVRIVEQLQGTGRLAFDAGRRILIVLLDAAAPGGGPPDGLVDHTYTMHDVRGEWPLGPHWEGRLTIERSAYTGGMGVGYAAPPRFGLLVEGLGLIHLAHAGPPVGGPFPSPWDETADPEAVATLTVGRYSATVSAPEPFDRAEAHARQLAAADGLRGMSGMSGAFSVAGEPAAGASVRLQAVGPAGAFRAGPAWGTPVEGALRVGGSVPPPRKVHDQAPVYPDQARAARLQGVVIVEVTVGVEGAVHHARVLRSIPQLDVAALEAVRQWRFEPVVFDGRLVPVVMTVTVPFGMERP